MTSAGGQSRRLELFLFPKVFGRHRPARCCLSCQLAHPSPGALTGPLHTWHSRGSGRARALLCSADTPGEGQRCGTTSWKRPDDTRQGQELQLLQLVLCTGQGRAERNPRFGACAAQGRAHLQTPVRRHWDEDILLYCLPPD